MEKKTMAAMAAAALVVLAGAAFAMPNWFGGFIGGQPQGVPNNGTWQNQTGGWHGPRGMMNGTGWKNQTAIFGHGRGMGFNATSNQTVQQFDAAVQSGDYQTALQLNQQYGIGGPIIGKLNATTFATYSQIYSLQSQMRMLEGQLGQAIGMNMQAASGTQLPAGTHPAGMMAGKRGFGFGRGMRHG